MSVDKAVVWIETWRCDPPHRITHPEKYDELRSEFIARGWGDGCPALLGYSLDGRVQLVSGSQRWAAAHDAGLKQIPVVVVSYDDAREFWGSDQWIAWVQKPPMVVQ